jgi:hypothetical protein
VPICQRYVRQEPFLWRKWIHLFTRWPGVELLDRVQYAPLAVLPLIRHTVLVVHDFNLQLAIALSNGCLKSATIMSPIGCICISQFRLTSVAKVFGHFSLIVCIQPYPVKEI